MKKFIAVLGMLGVLGYFGYDLGMDFVSDKLSDQFSSQFANDFGSNIKEIKRAPEVKTILEKYQVENIEDIDAAQLAYKTKVEALKDIATKFKVSEVKNMLTQAKDGLTSEEQNDLLGRLKEKLSTDELDAIKILALKEMMEQPEAK